MSIKEYGLAAVLSLAIITTLTFAAGYGTSKIVLSSYSVTVVQGSANTVTYNVSLNSGGVWGSNINIANSSKLSSEGVSVLLSTGSGEPPFSGRATISASPSAALGTYTAAFNVTGDDPSVNTAVLNITILAPPHTNATSSAQTTAPTSTIAPIKSTSTANYSYGSGSGSAEEYAAIGIVAAIIVIAIIILFATRRR